MKNDLDARKKALMAEAEVYRQAMKLEIQNVVIYTKTRKQHYSRIGNLNPLVSFAVPVLTALFNRRKQRGGFSRLIHNALLGWKFYSQVMPSLRGLWYIREPEPHISTYVD